MVCRLRREPRDNRCLLPLSERSSCMDDANFAFARTLAEVLRIQRWAGGDWVPADRIFGLMHGFESVLRGERESFGITEQTQEKVEDLLEAIDRGELPADAMEIKARLRADGIDETDALRVMQLCHLQSRFTDTIGKIIEGEAVLFATLRRPRLPEQDWSGAVHYMELVDSTGGVRKKMHAVFAPAVPRVGETVTPQAGSVMEVVGVDHVVMTRGDREGHGHPCLVPHIILVGIKGS